MSKVQDISSYRFAETDKLFFDTNIWLLIYGPQGNPQDPVTQNYSGALSNALQAKSQILIDVLVVSEFVNRFARIEYDIQYPNKSNRPSFKHFRNSPAFRSIAQAIASSVRQILKFTARAESGFTGIDIQALLSEFGSGKHDFNDQVLVRLCQAQNLKLVTHDADFRGKGVNILTANSKILAP